MTVERDPSPAFAEFAHPERLVSTDWLAEHLGEQGLVVVESDGDVLLYETGHIEGAVKIDWHTDLNDPVTRDYIDGAGFAALLGSKGISRDTTAVIYGDVLPTALEYRGPIHVADLYQAELRWFGVPTVSGRVILCDFFREHHWPAVDVI